MSSIVSKLVAASRRPGPWVRRALRWLLTGLAVLWLVLLALWLLLHGLILPNANRWRPEIEVAATRALGVSVHIGQLTVQTRGWMPSVDLHDLRLVDAQGREALRLPRVSAAASPRSLLAWPPRLEQLYVHAPDLAVRRDREGHIWVAGVKLSASAQAADGDAPFSDWLLRQYEVALEGGRLRWIDEQRGAPALQLTDVRGVLRNGLRRHEWRLDATPPAELGQRLSLRARFTQPLLARPSDWRRWSGLFYFDFPQTHLSELRQRLALPLDLSRGDGRLRAWAELAQGRVRDLTLDLQLTDVHLRAAPGQDVLALSQLSTRLAWQRMGKGTRWSVRGLQMGLAPTDGTRRTPAVWPLSNATLTLEHPLAADALPWQVPAQLNGGALQADRLDLALLARLAAKLPLNPGVRRLLLERAPQGQVRSLNARWTGHLEAPSTWRLEGEADALAVAPTPVQGAAGPGNHPLGQPGLEGASVRFSANQQGGDAHVRIQDGALHWPGLLVSERLPLREAEWPLRWQRDAAGWHVQATRARLETPDVNLRLDAQWHSGPGPGGRIELSAQAPQVAVQAVPRHLPLALPLLVRQYLGDALQGGVLRELRLELKGALADFPFRAPAQGRFRVSAKVQDGRYAYLPSHPADDTRAAHQSPWPGFEALQGDIRFEGAGMQLRVQRGRSAGLEVSEVNLRIDDLAHQPQLRVGGRWRGEVPQALAFVRQTPVNTWTHGVLAQAQGSGTVGGELQLGIPLDHPERASVRGTVQLPSAGLPLLRLRNDLPPFTQVRGSAEFSNQGVQLPRLNARFLGGELRVSGGSRDGGQMLYLEADGQASAEGLRAAAQEWPALGTLAPYLSGQADYRARLAFKGEQPELELRSSLQGMVSSLPEPLKKAAAESWPLLLRVQPQEGGREAWGLSLGGRLQALLEREGPRTRRGAIRLGSEGDMPLPAQGVHLTWAAPQIDLDPWQRAFGAAGAAPSPALASDAWLPDGIELRTPLLRLHQRRLTDVQAQLHLAPNRRDWRMQLQSSQAVGDVQWRQAPNQPPHIQARLTRLAVPQGEAEQVDRDLDAVQSALPQLDLQAEQFELRGKKLGSLRVRADGAPAGQDWRLQELSVQHPHASLHASGLWRAAERRTQLDWQLDIRDAGRWLDALGFADTVRGGKGALQGVLAWRGSPLSPSSAGLDGQFSVKVAEGQFLKADPGVARLLGILSLQSLPRRLLFDWRDVFSGGFAFDEFAGDVRIANGLAHTSNLRMRGLQANVLMEGSADLGAETTDLKVLVVPNLDAGGATLAYTAVNPAIGLTTFLAQLLLKKPIEAANTTELHVSGPWADPKVEKVARKAPPPAPKPADPKSP